MFTVRQLARLVAMAGLLAASTPALTAQTLSPDEIASLLDTAATKEDHLKLAGHYAVEAKQLREDAIRHDAMASRYKKLPARPSALREHMAQHCSKLATSLSSASKEADELASAHREMAKDSK